MFLPQRIPLDNYFLNILVAYRILYMYHVLLGDFVPSMLSHICTHRCTMTILQSFQELGPLYYVHAHRYTMALLQFFQVLCLLCVHGLLILPIQRKKSHQNYHHTIQE